MNIQQKREHKAENPKNPFAQILQRLHFPRKLRHHIQALKFFLREDAIRLEFGHIPFMLKPIHKFAKAAFPWIFDAALRVREFAALFEHFCDLRGKFLFFGFEDDFLHRDRAISEVGDEGEREADDAHSGVDHEEPPADEGDDCGAVDWEGDGHVELLHRALALWGF